MSLLDFRGLHVRSRKPFKKLFSKRDQTPFALSCRALIGSFLQRSNEWIRPIGVGFELDSSSTASGSNIKDYYTNLMKLDLIS